MARPQAPDFEQRRQAIVERAAGLFARQGFAGTSMSDLAKACGASKSLLYHYYPSKEDVLYAVMASHIDQLVEDVRIVRADGGTPAEMLSALIHRFMDHYVGAAARQKVLLNELARLPEDKRRIIVAKQRTVIDGVQDLLTALTPALAEQEGRGRVQTMLVLGMINWTPTWFDPAGPVSAREIADMAVALARGSQAS